MRSARPILLAALLSGALLGTLALSGCAVADPPPVADGMDLPGRFIGADLALRGLPVPHPVPGCGSVIPGSWRPGSAPVAAALVPADTVSCAWTTWAGVITATAAPTAVGEPVSACEDGERCEVEVVTHGLRVVASFPALPKGVTADDVARRLRADFAKGLGSPARTATTWADRSCADLDPHGLVPSALGIAGETPQASAPNPKRLDGGQDPSCTWSGDGGPEVAAVLLPGAVARIVGTPVDSPVLSAAGIRSAAIACGADGCRVDANATGGAFRLAAAGAGRDDLIAAAARLAIRLGAGR